MMHWTKLKGDRCFARTICNDMFSLRNTSTFFPSHFIKWEHNGEVASVRVSWIWVAGVCWVSPVFFSFSAKTRNAKSDLVPCFVYLERTAVLPQFQFGCLTNSGPQARLLTPLSDVKRRNERTVESGLPLRSHRQTHRNDWAVFQCTRSVVLING
jgi:hypothetical protein